MADGWDGNLFYSNDGSSRTDLGESLMIDYFMFLGKGLLFMLLFFLSVSLSYYLSFLWDTKQKLPKIMMTYLLLSISVLSALYILIG